MQSLIKFTKLAKTYNCRLRHKPPKRKKSIFFYSLLGKCELSDKSTYLNIEKRKSSKPDVAETQCTHYLILSIAVSLFFLFLKILKNKLSCVFEILFSFYSSARSRRVERPKTIFFFLYTPYLLSTCLFFLLLNTILLQIHGDHWRII